MFDMSLKAMARMASRFRSCPQKEIREVRSYGKTLPLLPQRATKWSASG